MLDEYKHLYTFIVKTEKEQLDIICFQKEKLNPTEFQNLKKDVMKINKGFILEHEYFEREIELEQ